MIADIIWLLLLILDIYTIIQIANTSLDGGKKALWIIIVLFLPLLGPILWFAIGKGTA